MIGFEQNRTEVFSVLIFIKKYILIKKGFLEEKKEWKSTMKSRKIMWHFLEHSDFALSLNFIQIYVLKWNLGEVVKDKKPSKNHKQTKSSVS